MWIPRVIELLILLSGVEFLRYGLALNHFTALGILFIALFVRERT